MLALLCVWLPLTVLGRIEAAEVPENKDYVLRMTKKRISMGSAVFGMDSISSISPPTVNVISDQENVLNSRRLDNEAIDNQRL